MDVKNSSGRVVSLLNNTPSSSSSSGREAEQQSRTLARPQPSPSAAGSFYHHQHQHHQKSAPPPPPPPPPPHHRRYSTFNLPSLSSLHPQQRPSASRSTSISSSYSSQSPNTPHLIRSDSTDSRAFSSPSPTTPVSSDDPYFRAEARAADRHLATKRATEDMNPHFPILPHPPQTNDMQGSPSIMDGYSMVPDNAQNPNGPFFAQQPFPPPNALDDQRNYSTTTVPKASQKKNTYPCPVAKQYGCQEFFTTSGHAARHAKKHTGKKDAICPECSKAFTRKDNMEQHRRTHSGVRSNVKATPSSDEQRTKKAKVQQQKRSRPAPTITPVSSDMGMDMLDPALRDSSSNMFPHIDETQYQMTYPTAPAPSQQPHYPSPPNADYLHPALHPSTQDSPMSSVSATSLTHDLQSPSLAPALDALALAASRQ